MSEYLSINSVLNICVNPANQNSLYFPLKENTESFGLPVVWVGLGVCVGGVPQ